MVFAIPPRSEVGVLSAEIAGEGERVIHSDGEQVTWTPPPPRPVMPDWSQIKSIARYFNRQGFQVWPAWLYHPSDQPRLVKNAQDAGELGICYRQATPDEMARYGRKDVWDWSDDCKWRPQPWETPKFDAAKPGQGKIHVASAPNPMIAQNALVEALIPQVAAAVAQALKSTGPSAPAHIDAKDWDDFLKFKAFQKSAEAINEIAREDEPAHAVNALNALTAEEERMLWEDEAKRKGIKTDGRWSLQRLKEEVEKAA